MSKKLFFLFPILAILMIIGCALPVAFAAKESGLEVEYTVPVTNCNVGEKVKLPEVVAVSPDRVSSITLSVKKPSGAEAPVKANAFFADEAGEFKVYIVVVGVNGDSNTEFYSVNATVADYPFLVNAPYVPDVYLSGKTYKVPVAKFVDYTGSAPVDVEYRVEYHDEAGKVSAVNGTFVPTVLSSGNKVKLKYIAEKGGKQNTVTYEIPVMIADGKDEAGYTVYDYANLFYSQGAGVVSVSDKGVELSASQNAKFYFANALNASFKFEFLSVQGFNSFGGVRAVITDALDKDVSISLTVKRTDAPRTTTLVLNDEQSYTANGSFNDLIGGVKFEFNNANCFVKDNTSANVCRITKTLNGDDFSGFPSKRVYLTFEIIDANVAYKLNVTQINSHYFSQDGYDGIPPFVVLEDYVKMDANVGDKVVVPAGFAADVVDANAKAYVTVTKNNVHVKDVNGTPINKLVADRVYEFVAEETGSYVIQYFASDESENVYDVGYYTVYVSDNESPVVTLKSSLKPSYTWGSTITIPEFDATDNGGVINSLVYVTGPLSGFKIVNPGDSFTFNAYGKYFIHYMIYDDFGNLALIDLTVEVV